ncbi:MAG: hypothetical protein CMA87_03990, partial [Euryarchaeota archaeon]|nr:hypothetical protein [Euryarchaeota archaeon]
MNEGQVKKTFAILFALMTIGCGNENHNETPNEVTPLEIVGTNAFWYYNDLNVATDFYTKTLGLRIVADYGYAKIL